ncbi:glycosyltransferase family 2 protein [Gemmobacter caeruleus]|uniref:glycosyltransferase family 2 protein n=1 Tax=Gemmobacter caeruleus TaxID=2595004 RepID=UPI0011ED29CC|nr:glycosyltransferase family 2 protein [Gemmobacter caeruleus]
MSAPLSGPRAFLVGTAKNEGPHILEWVAHHLELGFTDIALFQNDSDDLTPEIARCLADLGAIQYFRNPARRGAHQVKAYTRAADLPEYQAADLVMALDLDEMLVVKTGDGTLADLIAAAPDFDLMMVNWRLFGHGGRKMQGYQLQSERFTMADYVMADDEHFNAYKALFRPGPFSRPGIHKPPEAEEPFAGLRVVNGSGLPLDRYQVRNYNSTDPGGQALAQINHYIVRDLDSFLVKTQRGSAHNDDRDVGLRYWAHRNRNYVEDLSITRFLPRIVARMRALDEASGGRLMRLRRQSIALHKEKFVILMDDPEMRALRRDCLKFEGHVPLLGPLSDYL